MHIRQSILIEATPERVMEAARMWMRGELHGVEGEIIERTSADGSPSISSVMEQDGIRMTTALTAIPHLLGTRLALEVRTEGTDRSSRLRNLSLFPGKRVVARQAKASLLEIRTSVIQESAVEPGV